jgi:hypothetical protein
MPAPRHRGTRKDGRASPARVRRAEKQAQALDLRAAGASFRQIAGALGISVSNAHSLVGDALDSIVRPSAERLLKLELHRLDQALMAVWQAVRQGDVAAVHAFLRISEHRMRLCGVLQPTSYGLTLNQAIHLQAREGDEGVLVIRGETKEEYIAGLRAARGAATGPEQLDGRTAVQLPLGNGSRELPAPAADE